jgi:folate-binding protein YgfZ
MKSRRLETPLLDLHQSAGAEIGEYCGTLLAEYAAARCAVALVDTNFRAFFSFSGPDAQRYVNAVLTSNVRDLKPGEGAVGLLLTPQGHILAEIEALALADGILTVSHAMVRERTFSTFDKFIIMDDVTLEDVTPSTGTIDLVGPFAAVVILEETGVDIAPIPELTHIDASLGSIPCRIIRHTCVDRPAATLVVARECLAALWKKLASCVRAHDGAPAGLEALNSIRLEGATAWFGHDYDDKDIPHEAGLEHSHINYEKGCYVGQEIVVRVQSRGHANRRLTELQFLASTTPTPGTKLFTSKNVAGSEVGHITSAGYSLLLGRPIGIGYLRREHSSIGTPLDASGTPAEVISPPSIEKKTAA